MLARSAQGLYWMSRYLERSEFIARLLELQTRALVDRPLPEIHFGWRRIYGSLGISPPAGDLEPDHSDDYALADSYTLAGDLTFEPSNPSSMRSCFAAGRENAARCGTASPAGCGRTSIWRGWTSRTSTSRTSGPGAGGVLCRDGADHQDLRRLRRGNHVPRRGVPVPEARRLHRANPAHDRPGDHALPPSRRPGITNGPACCGRARRSTPLNAFTAWSGSPNGSLPS